VRCAGRTEATPAIHHLILASFGSLCETGGSHGCCEMCAFGGFHIRVSINMDYFLKQH
jgi:hypothetical protein